MKYFVIDTTTYNGSLGYYENKDKMLSFDFKLKKSFSEIIPSIIELIKKIYLPDFSNLEFMGVNIGPGSFTGTRIGLSVAKSISFSFDVPIVPITGFEILYEKSNFKLTIPFVDARKKQVFSEIKIDNRFILKPGFYFPDFVIKKAPKNSYFIGNGVSVYKKLLIENNLKFYKGELFSQQQLAKIALRRFKEGKSLSSDEIEPLYLRKSEAEINKLKK